MNWLPWDQALALVELPAGYDLYSIIVWFQAGLSPRTFSKD